MMWDYGWLGWAGWLVMGLIVITVVVVTVVVAVAAARQAVGRPVDEDPLRAADAVLAERYARGEIDEQEYQHRHDVLHPRSELT